MKNLLMRAFMALAMLCALPSHAQFAPGQPLTASQLNATLAAKTSNAAAAITGGTITGVTITGLPAPIPVASGGTGVTTATGTGSLVLASGATLNNVTTTGAFASPAFASFGNQSTWLRSLISCSTDCAQTWSQSTGGGSGLLGATRSSDNTLAGSMAAQGVAGYAINDNTTQVQTVYGGYFEARRAAGAGTTQGSEIDVVNQGAVVGLDPYNMFTTGTTPALWLSSGRPDVTSGAANASAALGIINNNTAFENGIVFHSSALNTTAGEGNAIVLPQKDAVVWYGSAGNKVAAIRSDATTASFRFVFGNGSYNFQTIAGTTVVSGDTSGNVTANGTVTALGNVSANSTSYMLGNIAGLTLPGNNTTTGTNSIGWNRSNGGGETDFVNAKGGGSTGGFQWYQWNGTASTLTATLTQNGNFSTTGGIDGTAIGANTPNTGKFTTLSSTGTGAMPLYSTTGASVNAPHMVQGSVALSSGSATVTLSGSAVFSSSSSYTCTANDTTSANAVKVTQGSGTSITFTGTGTDTVQFLCAGN
ncbi:hypothetical protein [Burkholderia sp. HI2500]|uniref:hypothetical protein n=1 Tax=Burkholderia sp. HI2500 TaxID=2015358 RepID=UPI00211B68C1|nr:hypothetical protein [Burkholderia sp. HI2500]